MAEEFSVPFIGKLPIDPELCRNLEGGKKAFHQTILKSAAFEAFKRIFGDGECLHLK